MELNDYQQAALGTAIYPADINSPYLALGLAGETGEVCDKIKKEIRDCNSQFGQASRQEIAKELGDVMWYLSCLSHELGYTLDEIANMNVEKIQSRLFRNKLHGQGDNR